MIDSIGSSTTVSTQRAQSAAQTNTVRNADVLNAVQQSSQKKSNAVSPVKIFAVPQGAKPGATTNTKVPRGSLIDVLA